MYSSMACVQVIRSQVPLALHETITLSPAHGVRMRVFRWRSGE